MKPDISAYNLMLITDRLRSKGRSHVTIVNAALAGGVRLFQLREPDLMQDVIGHIAEQIIPPIHSAGGLLMLNDWIELVLDTGADGVHLGVDDLPIPQVRELIGDERLIGFSAHNRYQALRAAEDGADYITLSPAFPMSHKDSLFEPHGPEGLWKIADEIGIPTFFLGGIKMANLPELLREGKKTRVAIVSAITGEDDMTDASRKILAML